jgi:outer membrane lipoprotein SlyB
MRKTLIMMALLLPIAACSQTEQGAAIGGLGGAAIGSAVARDPVQGAILGGAIGAVGGALIGNASERGQCRYRDGYGRVYVSSCPSRYEGRSYDRRYQSRRYNNYRRY